MPKTHVSCLSRYFQTGFFRTSMNALFDTSGPTLRLDRLDSRRDLTAGRAASPAQDAGPGWTTRLGGASPAAPSLSSSTRDVSSDGRDERLHVEGSGVLTSSRISSLDLGGLSDCPVSLPPLVSSGHRVGLSIVLIPASLLSGPITERQQHSAVSPTLSDYYHFNNKLHLPLICSFCWPAEPLNSFSLLLSSIFTAL